MNANDLFNAVMQLDLTPIKTKLMHLESGEGWSLEKADAVEKEYRRFLCLMKLFPAEDTAPLVDVDTFWHYHILDTMKYAADCEQVFGYFLHHYPYVGMRGEDDEQFRLDSGDRMRELYENVFGEAYPVSFDADRQATAYCAGPVPPHAPVQAIDASAVPAPHTDGAGRTAYCAGPVPPHKLMRGIQIDAPIALRASAAANTAYCAGPVPPHKRADAKVAYCAGPVPPHKSAGANTAYCAGPVPPHKSAGANTAYCAGPVPPHKSASAKVAYCAGPVPPHKSAGAKVAYCAGPVPPHKSAGANTAYCAGPVPPHKLARGQQLSATA